MRKKFDVEMQDGLRVIPVLARSLTNPCVRCCFPYDDVTNTCNTRTCMPHERGDNKDVYFTLAPIEVEKVGSGEVDPSGKTAHEVGAKLDAGKVRAGLVLLGFSRALQEVAKVGTFGANKYTDNGWVDVPNGEARYTDALLRHYLSEASGEVLDPESGLMHKAHAAWNALAILELEIRRREE